MPWSAVNFLGALLGREIVSPDHVDWYTWRTLTTLLSRHGWVVESFVYYANPPLHVAADRSFADRVKLRATNGLRRTGRPIFGVWPALADGMVAVARRRAGPPTRQAPKTSEPKALSPSWPA